MKRNIDHLSLPDVIPADIPSALDSLGIEYTIKGSEATALCPDPGHNDGSPSWSCNLNTGKHHCLGGETMVMTWNGPRRIDALAGAEHRLLTSAGWQTVPVRSFGRQELWEITVSRNGVKKVIRATSGHRWITRTTEVTTDRLRTNHRLRIVASPGSHNLSVSRFGVAQGFCYGDGTVAGTHARVTLWGGKDAAVEAYYPGQPTRLVMTENGVPGVEVSGLPRHWKELPSADYDSSFLYGWLAGYFAADGCVDENGMPTISSADKGNLEFVKLVCDRIGVFTHEIRFQFRQGMGEENTPLYSLSFGRKSLTPDFFIAKSHRERFLEHRNVRERRGWSVVSVIRKGAEDEVFCAEVPESHDFALEGNLLTGNCFSCGFGGSFEWLVRVVKQARKGEAVAWIRTQKIRLGTDVPAPKVLEVSEADLWEATTPESVWCDQRGITKLAAAQSEVLFNHRLKQWIFPYRDPETDRLIGWQEKGTGDDRFVVNNYPPKVKKGHVLFGYQSLKATGTAGAVVVVESPLDVAVFKAAGIERVVSTFGTGMTDFQVNLIWPYADEIVWAFDFDAAGQKAVSKWIHDNPFGRRKARVFNYGYVRKIRGAYVHPAGDGRDPGECTRQQLLNGIEYATPASFTYFEGIDWQV
jgi:hypothetical protein